MVLGSLRTGGRSSTEDTMARTTKFPRTVHVAIERYSSGDSFVIREGGLESVEANGEEYAIYMLAEVGTIEIKKLYVPRKAGRR